MQDFDLSTLLKNICKEHAQWYKMRSNCIGNIDGTVLRIEKLKGSIHRRIAFHEHKRKHSLNIKL